MPFAFVERERRAFDDPVSLIRDFLDQLERLLRNIVHDTVEGFDFKPDLGADRELIEAALADTEEHGFFERAAEGIGG